MRSGKMTNQEIKINDEISIFQQDGARLHYTLPVPQVLDESFLSADFNELHY